jgi:capsule polysaccharide export protein KpsE/RkpR
VTEKKTSSREVMVETVDHRHDFVNPVEEIAARQKSVAVLRLLWNQRRLLFRSTGAALLASILIALLIPVRYQSTTRLMPPDGLSSSPGLGMLSAMTGMAGGAAGAMNGGGLASLLGMKSSGALFVGILESQTVQDRLIGDFNLMRVYHDSKIEDARKDLTSHTDVSEDRRSGIITISVVDHDPKQATAMAQAYVNELDRLVAQVSTSAARRERIFLQERLGSVKSELDDAAHRFSEFASKNTAIDIPAQGRAMVEAAAGLQGELIAAQSELEGLKQSYTDNNVRVRAMQARVNELSKKLNEIGGAGTNGNVSPEDPMYPSIRKLPLLGVTYADLFRQTKIEETVYGLLTEQFELAKVEEAKEIPSVKVLDAPVMPTKRVFPPRVLLSLAGTLLGLIAVVTWILGKSRWEAVDIGDPRKEFATEVVETVLASWHKFPRNGGSNGSNGSNGHRTWAVERLEESSTGNGQDKDRDG